MYEDKLTNLRMLLIEDYQGYVKGISDFINNNESLEIYMDIHINKVQKERDIY